MDSPSLPIDFRKKKTFSSELKIPQQPRLACVFISGRLWADSEVQGGELPLQVLQRWGLVRTKYQHLDNMELTIWTNGNDHLL